MDAKQILEQCAREEELYRFDAFTQTDALALGTLIYQKSLDKESPVAIEIRMNRLTVFSFYPSGTNENNRLWLAAKARTVDMNQQSSLRFWAELQVSGKSPEDMIGVRTPALRSFAKRLLKEGREEAFLEMLPHPYFDEDQLHAFVISLEKAFDKCAAEVDAFLPL